MFMDVLLSNEEGVFLGVENLNPILNMKER